MAIEDSAELEPADWLLRDRHVIGGLDQLGIQVVSVNLYRELLPGITNVTDRARYYGFFPWVLARYSQRGDTTTSKVAWRRWVRRFEYAYAVACAAFEKTGEAGSAITAVVGLDLARREIRDLGPADVVELHRGAEIDDAGRAIKGTYFKNAEGGFAQYYRVALGTMGLILEDPSVRFPDRALTSYAGVPLSREIDACSHFQRLLKAIDSGSATLEEMTSIGREVAPGAIKPETREQEMLRSLFFADPGNLCSGQRAEASAARRASLTLLLEFVRDAGGVDGGVNAVGEEFRWACFDGSIPTGTWNPLGRTRLAWRMYQANDLLNFALESLHWAAITLMLDAQFTPRRLASELAALGCRAAASLEGSVDVVGSISVGELVETSRNLLREPGSTRAVVESIREGIEGREVAEVAALAVRLLGMLSSSAEGETPDVGHAASEIFERFEVNLERLRQRASTRSSETCVSFMRDIVLEWILFRHLRVATRKLSQGDSTFKFRPEEGKLVAVVDEPPEPTMTMPRLRQAVRILVDLGLLTEAQDKVAITVDGARVLGAT